MLNERLYNSTLGIACHSLNESMRLITLHLHSNNKYNSKLTIPNVKLWIHTAKLSEQMQPIWHILEHFHWFMVSNRFYLYNLDRKMLFPYGVSFIDYQKEWGSSCQWYQTSSTWWEDCQISNTLPYPQTAALTSISFRSIERCQL